MACQVTPVFLKGCWKSSGDGFSPFLKVKQKSKIKLKLHRASKKTQIEPVPRGLSCSGISALIKSIFSGTYRISYTEGVYNFNLSSSHTQCSWGIDHFLICPTQNNLH